MVHKRTSGVSRRGGLVPDAYTRDATGQASRGRVLLSAGTRAYSAISVWSRGNAGSAGVSGCCSPSFDGADGGDEAAAVAGTAEGRAAVPAAMAAQGAKEDRAFFRG